MHDIYAAVPKSSGVKKLSLSKTFEKAPLKTAMPDESHTSDIKEDHIGY